ncbi:NDR1/HIN1-like protein 26 [Senna tora]|uniref:NDR1/HIN1-like protein 26 n=1 Tax=Senna tora TaxID=362788 RepID=A0A834TLR6_9FABA|nr:NDR1/HIN1-like protein 26 [Senna tora]
MSSCCFLPRRVQPAGPPGTGGAPTTSSALAAATSLRRRLTLVLVLLFVILMLIISVAWVALHPHAPTFSLASLTLSTNDDISRLSLSGKYDVVVAIRNPNKKVQVFLDRLVVFVLYDDDDDDEVAKVEVGYGILVGKMGRNNLKVSVESVVKKEEIVKDVGEEWRRGGVVKKLKVKILGRVRYSGGKSYWLTKYKLLKLIPSIGKDDDCHVS